MGYYDYTSAARSRLSREGIAYVSGFEYDLFFSYAHADSPEWIRALEESLRQELIDRLGSGYAIGRDKNRIELGQDLPEEIKDSVKGRAAFLAVMSDEAVIRQGRDGLPPVTLDTF